MLAGSGALDNGRTIPGKPAERRSSERQAGCPGVTGMFARRSLAVTGY